jgi:hypothetical protein
MKYCTRLFVVAYFDVFMYCFKTFVLALMVNEIGQKIIYADYILTTFKLYIALAGQNILVLHP